MKNTYFPPVTIATFATSEGMSDCGLNVDIGATKQFVESVGPERGGAERYW